MHHKPKTACGYDLLGNCRGIQLLLIPEEISCTGINNFFALPTKFQGVVKNVLFIDLGSVPFSIICIELYDPLGNGLFDAYGKLNGAGTSSNVCYALDPLLRPGILLPAPLLSVFSPATLLAVPTVALGTVSNVKITNLSNILSACTGFKITVKRVHANTLKITIAAGIFQAASDLFGLPISTEVKGVVWLNIKGKLQIKNIQVWLVAQLNISNHTWKGFLTYTYDGKKWWLDGHWGSLALLHTKKKMLGTVSYINGKLTVLQQACSPVDLRDGTDIRIPGTLDIYVFIYDTSRGSKRWIPLKECG